ncbi:MAG: peroxidase family protein, partial [Pseudomonadota bacterium]
MAPTAKRSGCAHAHGRHQKACIVGEGGITDAPDGFRFGRLFKQGTFNPLILKESFAKIIAREMVKPLRKGDSPIPAGFTYFGQFVDHDITRDITAVEADDPATDPIEPTSDDAFETMQGRSPSLDLDSLYGHPTKRDDALFRDGGPSFKIGRTEPVPPQFGGGHSGKAHPLDLPRREAPNPPGMDKILVADENGNLTEVERGRLPAIPDERNDENLIVAQIHLMWMLFHNNIVGALESAHPDKDAKTLFAEARALVTRHYQHVVLHDFVRRLIMKEVYEEVIVERKRTIFQCGPGEVPFMPLEFSVAAYRLGHSMVRQFYAWNLNFGTGNPPQPGPVGFRQFFEFSGLSGTFRPGFGQPPGNALPSNWIADHRHLFELSGYNPAHLEKAGPVAGPLKANKIDPYLAP